MQNEIKSKLVSALNDGTQFYKTATDVCEIHKTSLKELDHYMAVIPEFFSYNNEAVRIKMMYKRLKELDYARNKVIPCVNIEAATRIYNEYFDGMINFAKDYIQALSSSNNNLALMEKQLQTALQADSMFIDSLFGGKNNESTNEELTEAVKNVEFLVDFIDWLKSRKETINNLCNNCSSADRKACAPVIGLVASSVCRFSNRVISDILSIYEAINDSLDDKQVKLPDATFKLF